ncbi:autotransporter outer membrane beta-barrel domain-containing protein [Paucibacter sp. Y2R2-4]|uniref:autotransporter outer membrane beta-barrel domain-containing protein n=1 Tax=Paucibacter sp. Y2R2-4 TaxID=2893553 RepID=UPI0021E37369|nr:autotransporter outer membrane beta-barrel domain-containing protein [Paucibacter sp. Y2R2-4]MCV2348290.1 autotransporter outer membrane beta-barrel domain-containing protein [Paucibacter sp. Y2R2-4]
MTPRITSSATKLVTNSHAPHAAFAHRPLRRLMLARGWGILCLCAPTAAWPQAVTAGPSYYFADARSGANGTAGKDAVGGGSCVSGPVPGTAGAVGPSIDETVNLSLMSLVYPGTLIGVSSRGGDGGKGGNGDASGQCGKGDFDGRPGAAGGSVTVFVKPGANPVEAIYSTASTGVVAVSHGGSGGNGGDNTRGKNDYKGGDGGAGGAGGNVRLENALSMQVSGGLGALGLVAQSGGGAGGTGGDAANKANAGSGKSGGTGGDVVLRNTGKILTDGGNAMSAQSIGGFGGDGGVNTKSHSGSGGTGGNGGTLAVDNTGSLQVGSGSRVGCNDSVTTNCNPAGGFGLAAQSVGGGGGHAGASAGLHILGAEGGAAGHAGAVVVNNTGSVSVFSPSSTGLFAQAIGGGGGSGGMAISSGSKTTAVGGAGGAGGDGGAVTVINWNSLCTGVACNGQDRWAADDSTAGGAIALVAQSIGGGGGVGGFAKAKGRATTIFGNASAMAVGGTGGSGGVGAKVLVTHVGHLGTAEISSPALLAQSIGGGGGSAGGALAYATALAGDSAAVSHGGAGGGGGNGGNVLVNCNSYSALSSSFSPCAGTPVLTAVRTDFRIATTGLASPGIVAQSIGGGGGAGGYAMSLSGSLFGSQSLGFGGSGGAAGTGGQVFASSNGQSINTSGAQSPGLLAQSIGGGGGSGGSTMDLSLAYTGSSASLGVGGKGGSGQAAGAVAVHNPGGLINTSGEGSQGLVAQSIGGGGGNGGSAITLAVSGRYAGSLAVGGNGATGGTGGNVTLVNEDSSSNPTYGRGAITTQGSGASALVAQSIGGGGGHGGYSVALSGAEFVAGTVSVGGSGGSGNHAGTVNVTNKGALTTQGGGAPVLLAQSIGGGGGSGGHAIAGTVAGMGSISIGMGGSGGSGAVASSVQVNSTGAIAAQSSQVGHAPGILAQSIGGGGGQGGFSAAGALSFQGSVALAVGGGGGNAGSAGTVSIDHGASLLTRGAFSPGIQGQSLGGNGGNGGHTLAGALAGGLSLAANLGGGGGKGGTGGDVWLHVHGPEQRLVTEGDQSPGVLGQSLGGSGGTGGWAASASASMAAAPSVSLGGAGGAGGKAGLVSMTARLPVQTSGHMAPGLAAQSIGGNGGSGGFTAAGSATTIVAMATSIGGTGGTGGQGGTVNIKAEAPVLTSGQQSFGLLAQSIGGNGGNGGSALSASASTGNPSMAVSVGAAGAAGATGGSGQNAGNVAVVGRSTVITQGQGAVGVVAQSIGGGGGQGGATAAIAASASGGDPNNKSMAAAVTVGGKGAAGGAGAEAAVRLLDAVQTGVPSRNSASGAAGQGDRAAGVLVQSIGGSGGQGGAASSHAIAGSAAAAVAIGGGGGSGSNAGNALLNFDAQTYLASNADLLKAYGNNPAAALKHYIDWGFGEGRPTQSFNAAQYMANYSDLQASFNGDLAAATNHYVSTGVSEGRSASAPAGSTPVALALTDSASAFVDPLIYIASHPDLIRALGNDPLAGLRHYRDWGYGEGRVTSSFNPAQYLANYADLRASFGDDTRAATVHWITTGQAEGRSASAAAGSTPVNKVSLPSVSTFGQQAPAMVAQSIGGGGGQGGAASASAVSNQHAASVAVGGFGAGGGDAGMVVVTPTGALNTTGAQSPGVLAQSIGGGGGHGGSASASADGSQGAVEAAGVAAYTGLVGSNVGNATVAVAQKFSQDNGAPSSSSAKNDNGVGASLSIGGAGGLGGKGSAVAVDSSALVSTLGDLSAGLYAQSVGGGGGHGGSSTSNAKGGNSAVAVSLGGSGGTGGDAGSVQVRNSGRIGTAGTQSLGVFAQSVGGGGGDGGSVSATSQAGGKAAASLGLGGSGGGGGSGGNVNLINTGSVSTWLGNAGGLFAQSVGGGGGNGGAASTAASVTPAADDGKTSASTGTASSSPNNQSNSASAGSVSGSTPTKGGAAGASTGYAASLALGGAGGKAGHGGTVVVQHSGSVSTGLAVQDGVVHSIAHAPALLAQSVGGGGGQGGSSSSNADAAKSSVAISLGGLGAGGGDGGTVAVHASAGNLSTRGALSSGLIAQSLGGGGGNGGSSTSTASQGSSASVAMGLGGTAGGGGHGGSVTVCGTPQSDGSCGTALGSSISTGGVQSHGVFAQSVGGGGGSGGAVSAAATAGDASGSDNSASTGNGSSSASASSGVAVAAALGGSGGSGGYGGDVRLSIAASISTLGARSTALFAQSVGGGGGEAGSSSSNASSGAHAVSLALGASGGSGGRGGNVSVDLASSAQLQTRGLMSQGLMAQSVGGGGGVAGSTSATSADAGNSNTSLSLGGKAGSGQDGGTVKVNSGGSISTSGWGADGLVAQSVGGGGGTGGAASSSASTGTAAASLALGGQGGASGKGGDVAVTLFSGSVKTEAEAARALLVQSIGGGGGSGGNASSNTGGDNTKSVSLALGGQSGSNGGGQGGTVNVSTNGTVTLATQGHFAAAVMAQSIGGGGGVGGSSQSSSSAKGSSYSLGLNLGGAGGAGGNGGAVTLALRDINSNISTQGLAAFGVMAQSIGGGGGVGGAAAWQQSGSLGSVSISSQLGGSGGDGGDGGGIWLLSDQTLSTAGHLAVGLLAQSVGGGGGVGAAATSSSEGSAFSGSVNLGGSGGKGGAGGTVELALGQRVSTSGNLAHAAVAQSIGGGGGLNLSRASGTVLGNSQAKAGARVLLSSSAAVETSGTGAAGLVAQSIGGGGGLSTSFGSATLGGAPGFANGGVVRLCNGLDSAGQCSGDVALTGSIRTHGALGHGLVAQSIGGGGGMVLSPENPLQTTLRGSGAIGSDVTVWTAQAISTQGHGAAGLVAQSIGAGGGLVGDHYWATGSVTHKLTPANSTDVSTGAAVSVDARKGSQAWSTSGMNAPALVAQSIGGGGGYFAHTNLTQASQVDLSFQLGGTGGSSDGGTAQVTLGSRAISTGDAGSLGVLAQSVAGGGGVFSWVAPTVAAPGSATSTNATLSGQLGQTGSGSRAFDASVSGSPSISTSGLHSAGLVVQSVSNGGGVALAAGRAGQVFNGTMNLGSTANGKNDWKFSGPVTVQLDGGSISTRGDMAPALVAQTVSGGGGLSLALVSQAKLGGLPGSPAYPGEDQRSKPAVLVNNRAAISTTGAGSIGIVAQSVGNGGGLAYASNSATIGAGGGGGHGGKVEVNSYAPIRTSGVNAYGILAQSVGGGGGAVIGVGNALTAIHNTGRGDAGDVTVNVYADIITSGDGAHGVVVQSVAGGGGIIASGTQTTAYKGGDGKSGVVKVNVATGVNVTPSGRGTHGIWGASSTDPIVEVAEGARVVGGSGGAAMYFEGPINELHNRGHVGSADGHAGRALQTSGGDITVHNYGTLLGDLHLTESARNEVHNHSGASMLHGGTLNLGGSGTLHNEGTIMHGGETGAATVINGHLIQGEGGTLALRMDHATGVADQLHVTGSATLKGRLQPVLQTAHLIAPGTHSLGTIFTAGAGLDASGLSVTDTAILDFRLHPQDGKLGFSVHADFSPEGMNEDVQRLGDLLGTAQSESRENYRDLTARLVALTRPEELHQVYWELSGAGATTVATVGTRLSTLFGRLLTDRAGTMSNVASSGQPAHHAWVQILGERHSATYDGAGTSDVEAQLGGLAFGLETSLDADTWVGAALSSNRSNLEMSHGYKAYGPGVQLGAYAVRQADSRWGQVYLTGSLTHSRQTLDTERRFGLMGSIYRAQMPTQAWGARVETGLRVSSPGWRVAPFAALQLQHYTIRAHDEQASDQAHLALSYQRSAFTQLRSELGAAVEGRVMLGWGASVQLRGRLGWAHESWSEHRMYASFKTLNGRPFSVTGLMPTPDLATLSGQAELRLSPSLAVEINLQGEYGQATRTRAGSVALRYNW